MISGNCGCSPQQANQMFRDAEQFVDDEITDRSYKMNRYWVDLYSMREFPDGQGLTLDKMRYFSDIGPQYDGFDGWRKIQRSRTGLAAVACGEHDACASDPETVGHGMETVSYDLMARDLETQIICIKDIRTYWQYKTFQDLQFRNLAEISANIREQLNRNAAQMYAIKHIAIAGLPTAKDPHQFPNLLGVEVGRLNYPMLLMLYHSLVMEAAPQALAMQDGMPTFGVAGHPETLRSIYVDDPELRKDIRYAEESMNLIKRYAFLDSVGPFILMPDLYAPRYDVDADGNLYRVFPFIRGVEIEYGTRPIPNPHYQTAPYEFIMFMLKDLFTLRARKELSTAGGETQFGPETNMFSWKWWNPPGDPWNRTGKYIATAEVGVEPGDFTDFPGILVKRRPEYMGIQFWEAQTLPPEPVEFDNALPTETCPCPAIVGAWPTIDPTILLFQFDRDSGLTAADEIELNLANGSFVAATVAAAGVSADGTKVNVDFGSAEPCLEPGRYVSLRCDTSNTYCSAKVLKILLGTILTDAVGLVLNRLLVPLAAADVVTLILNDGNTLDVAIASTPDTANLTYYVDMTYTQLYAAGGVCSVCVPPATDDTCPECDATQLIDCEEAT